ncbi:MAG TPA: SUMF1/EgtB/PvdO family nonheme iron enzyme [Chthoniobacteraceae bacterium]|nr:SUMF1/EgtB/PvdO family nonheme iron enzyme [Verrucomicrobiae bacterium]HWB61433.1 SUMF1/EgtB/PvdO family nonheme iron enzyme [Chthoniobacteraceae bacterium]
MPVNIKKLIPWWVCLLISGSLMGQEGKNAEDKNAVVSPVPADTSSLQLVIALTDGSRVIGTPAIDTLKLGTGYANLNIKLEKIRTIEFAGANHMAQVSLQNGDMLKGQLAATEFAVKTDSGQVVTPLAKVSKILVRAGSVGGDYVNSLGMEFITVPGMKVLFGIWDTRVEDYRAYATANPGVAASWKNPGFKQGEDHPVVNVNWGDAKAFCAWLTQKERKEGEIGQGQEYRLPTEKEWSVAVGEGKYPWGDEWPPQKGAGNYDPSFKVDDYDHTSPVGSFKANEYGLYDMGGNVWQWCEDWYDTTQKFRVVRGASWFNRTPELLLSSFRFGGNPGIRDVSFGFRRVLAPVSSSH